MTAPAHDGPEQSMAERYGDTSPAAKRARILAVGLLFLALVAWAVWAALDHASPAYGARIRSYDVVSPHQVRVQLDVHRLADAGFGCTVTAQAEDHSVVGEKLVQVPRGAAGDLVVTTSVVTDREATTAVISNCH